MQLVSFSGQFYAGPPGTAEGTLDLVVVPEPGTIIMLLGGLAGLAVLGRRRRVA